jgi:hypothetical protein
LNSPSVGADVSHLPLTRMQANQTCASDLLLQADQNPKVNLSSMG